jgi:hypothetical protein
MTNPHGGDSGTMKEPELHRRDWILLPFLGLLTIVLIAVSAFSVTNWLNPPAEIGFDNCFVSAGLYGGAPVKPNSVCAERTVESRLLAEYRFNRCGHRAGMECGPKPPGTYRIVMIGSSMAMGLFVPREMTFAALLPARLSSQTGRNIQIYNESTGGEFRGGPFPTPTSPQHFDEILSEDPDMILWVITPADISNMSLDIPGQEPRVATTEATGTSVQGSFAEKIWAAITDGSFSRKSRARWDQTAFSTVLKHFLYGSESRNQYVNAYLKNKKYSGFMEDEPDAKWQRSLELFQACAVELEMQARAAGVPLVAVMVPDRGQAAMISMGDWPAGYDPYKLDNELRATITSHGGTYVDILPDFRTVPNPEQHYFPVDGHPDADGHAMIAGFLAKELTGGAVPALRAAGPQTASAKGD